MSASDLFKAGQLDEAIAAQIDEVKRNPGDHARRLFLFELLSFAGEWERAERQIAAIDYKELELEAAVLSYKKLIEAERKRAQVFGEAVRPEFLQPPPPHVELRLQALAAMHGGQGAQARALLEEAAEITPEVRGTWNGEPFVGISDCDDLLGGVVEVLALGEYYWVPWEHLELVAGNPPGTPRDLIWRPVRLETREAASGDAFLPARYPHTTLAECDAELKLSRATDWLSTGEYGPTAGQGLRLVLVGDHEEPFSWLDLRELVIEPPSG